MRNILKKNLQQNVMRHSEPLMGEESILRMIQGVESGCSMVETLGVLAVMGVMSVAGVQGYQAAMKRYRANELINEASKQAVVLAMKVSAGQPLGENASAEFDTNSVSGATLPYITLAAVNCS